MKRFMTKFRTLLTKRLVIVLISGIVGCKDYLDIVPDNVATIENAFTLRNEAEKYLFTLYAFLPKHGDGWYNPGMHGGDEIFVPLTIQTHWHSAFRIALGDQNASTPLYDEWTGSNKGGNNGFSHQALWTGIRQCNIFIEEMNDPDNVPDMTSFEKKRWIAEAEVLRAYYHFYLFRMYGPIPIMNDNSPVGPDPTYKRMPVDDVVNFITTSIDSALVDLPEDINNVNNELGRMTKVIALAFKAKTLLYAASPLFNGNSDYVNFVDHDGVNLFPTTYDATKWELARDAIKDAIDAAHGVGHQLYYYSNDILDLSDQIRTELNCRMAVTDRWGVECVWGLSNSNFDGVQQRLVMPVPENSDHGDRFPLPGVWSVPLKIARMFYTENGVPIEEDVDLEELRTNPLSIRQATLVDRYIVQPNESTARLNYNREPRFYASLGFDRGVWYMADANETGEDEGNYYLKARNGEKAGLGNYINFNELGYWPKKLVHYESAVKDNVSFVGYPWPEIRLADLYLMYAEALNETGADYTLVNQWIDPIRERAGLNGVEVSWISSSNNPVKFSTQDGLREIIHQERLIELAFEGHRFWDLIRMAKQQTPIIISELNVSHIFKHSSLLEIIYGLLALINYDGIQTWSKIQVGNKVVSKY
jgi:hypothetical protein